MSSTRASCEKVLNKKHYFFLIILKGYFTSFNFLQK